MKKRKSEGLDFVVDKLTNSIENTISGENFSTIITRVANIDLKSVTRTNDWAFNWKYELKQAERDVYKLTTTENPSIIQGLLSIELKADHIFMHLVESAPFNKGKSKVYSGVPGNLVAFACRLSFHKGLDGNVSFISKTQLIDHYIESLGAVHFGGRLMIIEGASALRLINRYFKTQDT